MPLDGTITDFVTTNPVAKTLRDAAAYIEEHGWCQGKTQDLKTGAVCAFGAIWGLDRGWLFDLIASEAYVSFLDYVGVGNAAAFNDTPGRTKEEVIAALHSAADMVELRDVDK